jgi:hypothetical protein
VSLVILLWTIHLAHSFRQPASFKRYPLFRLLPKTKLSISKSQSRKFSYTTSAFTLQHLSCHHVFFSFSCQKTSHALLRWNVDG